MTIGQAFHWMDQEKILEKVIELLTENGGLAIVGGKSIWNGTEDWQRKTVEVIKQFLGQERRAGKGTFKTDKRKHEEVIATFPFSHIKVQKITNVYHWNTKKIIGYLYSTSFATKHLFGDQSKQFEDKLTKELFNINPAGKFTEQQEITLIMAWK